ncbi:MAG: hypothetical protein U1C46_04755, partial [Bacteroidales bacterium]|nr:hypothetical protein [Bacteroidales bacterium]
MKKYILTALFAAILVNISAQVITRTTDSKTIDNSIKLGNKSVTTIQVLPKFDVDKLLAEDEAEKAAGLPFRFGYIFETNYSIKNSGQWTELSEGRVWALQIVSKGAFSINLTYDKFYLPKGSHLYVYNSDKTVLQGPITSEHNTLDGQFATDLIQGSAIILEYFEPNEVKEKGIISISKVVHGYVNLFSEP